MATNVEYKIQVIFRHWNKYKGRGYGKVRWKSHTVLSLPTQQAIRKRLNQGFDVDTLTKAIDNYAKVLTSPSYKWTYAWTLYQFLVRRHPQRRDEEQLTRWLPGEFHEDDYITEQAKMIRARVNEPEPIVEVASDEEKARILTESEFGKRFMTTRGLSTEQR
jgi:hypothetical protein